MSAEKWFNEGIQDMHSRNFENAILNFSKSLKLDPKKSNPWYNMGLAFLHINLHPFYHNVFYIINFLFLRSYPYYIEDKIIHCFEKALEYNPNFIDAWYNLGLFYFEIENNEKAIECFNKILKIDTNNVEALYNLSKIYQDLEEFSTEFEYLEKIMLLDIDQKIVSMKEVTKRLKELRNILKKLP